MQGEYLIDQFHNVALQIGPLPGDRNALLERLKRIGFCKFSTNGVQVSSTALFAAPAILKKMVVAQEVLLKKLDPDLLCGVSLIGTTLSTHLGIETQTPILLRSRTEEGVTLHGDYFAGQRVLLIDDLFVSADEVVTTAYQLRKEGLLVTDLVVLLNAAERGSEQLAQFDLRLHALFTIDEFFPTSG